MYIAYILEKHMFLFFRFTADSRCGDPAEGRTGVARQPQGADPAVRFI